MDTEFMVKKAETQKATWAVIQQTAEATRHKIKYGVFETEMEGYTK